MTKEVMEVTTKVARMIILTDVVTINITLPSAADVPSGTQHSESTENHTSSGQLWKSTPTTLADCVDETALVP